VIFSEIINFLATITADLGDIVVAAVIVFAVIGISAVGAGCVSAAGTASDITAKCAGITRKSMGIVGDTKSRTAGGTGDVRKMDICGRWHIQILPAAVAAGAVREVASRIATRSSVGVSWQDLQGETEGQQ